MSLDRTALEQWRQQPAEFIETVMVDPETGQPFQLLDAERRFLDHAFRTDEGGRLLHPEMLFACPKKSGKTSFAAMCTLVVVLLFGGAYPEATLVANDLEQARGRVFEMAKRIVECSPLLRAEASITQSRIQFPALDATISAVAADYAGAAGGNQNVSVFDELWAYTTERSHRLWDELVPPPTRKIGCRLTVTYAGFDGESTVLEALYKRGLQQPQVGPHLYAGDGLLMFWSHAPIAPWQDERWLAQMRQQLRPNAYLRMIENRFVGSESSFIDMGWWDQCVDPRLRSRGRRPLAPDLGRRGRLREARQHRCRRRDVGRGRAAGAARVPSHLPAVPRRAARLRGHRRGDAHAAPRPLQSAAGALRSVSDGGDGAASAARGRSHRGVSSVGAEPDGGEHEPLRADQGTQPRRVPRRRHPPRDIALRRGGDKQGMADREGQGIAQDRRDRGARAGRAGGGAGAVQHLRHLRQVDRWFARSDPPDAHRPEPDALRRDAHRHRIEGDTRMATATSTKQTNTLDDRIAHALRDDASPDEIRSLIPEVEAAASAVRETAARARARALDPALTSREAALARDEQDDAAFAYDRLSAAVRRLREHRNSLRQSDADARRCVEYERVMAERDAVAAEVTSSYTALCEELVALLRRLSACDARVERVNAALPGGAAPLALAEHVARGSLQRSVGPDVPRLSRALRLPALRPGQHGARLAWPPEPQLSAVFAPPRPLQKKESA